MCNLLISKSMYLFFDTETTGLPKNWKAGPCAGDNWPRLVQFSWLEFDENQEETYRHDYIIRPEGWKISEEAAAVHGITQERAQREGLPLDYVLNLFARSLLGRTQILVAHNIAFDRNVVLSEFLRKQIKNDYSKKQEYCTMEAGTNLCQLPAKNGGRGFKWPKLQELYFHLFSREFSGAHNSLADVLACAECYFEMQK